MGDFLGVGQKVYVERVYVFFLSLNMYQSGNGFGLERFERVWVSVQTVLFERVFCTSAEFLKVRKKKEPKPKLFGPDIFGWGGGLPREGVGAKKFDMSFETQKNKFFGGYPGILPGYPGGPQKV